MKQLSKSDIKKIAEELQKVGIEVTKKDSIQQDDTFLIINGEKLLFLHDDQWCPTLKAVLQEKARTKKITVDMGAIKFVTGGADIMRPGITHVEENIQENEIITIIDENNKKPIAIGKTLHAAEQIQETKSGKVIKNLHTIGDDIWNNS